MKITPMRAAALSSAAALALIAGLSAGTKSRAPGSPGELETVAHAAPSKAAPNKSAGPQAKSQPAAKPPAGTPSEAAKQAFMKVIDGIKQKVATAPNKEKAAREGLATLQKYARTHAGKPISDSVRLTAAHLQAQLGDVDAAMATMRQIADKPIDKQIGQAAQLSLAQLLAQTGKFEESEKILRGIVEKNEDPELTENAQGFLAALAVRPGQKAVEFAAEDTAGQKQSISTYQGKVLLIDFWATWCGPCRDEMPNVKKVYTQFKDQGFAILGVSLDQQKSALEAYVKEQELPWAQIHDAEQKLASLYAVSAIPRTILVDRQGVIRHVDVRGEALGKAVSELVGAGKPAATP